MLGLFIIIVPVSKFHAILNRRLSNKTSQQTKINNFIRFIKRFAYLNDLIPSLNLSDLHFSPSPSSRLQFITSKNSCCHLHVYNFQKSMLSSPRLKLLKIHAVISTFITSKNSCCHLHVYNFQKSMLSSPRL